MPHMTTYIWCPSELEVDRNWTGSGPVLDWKWTGSGPEVDRKWIGSGPEVGLKSLSKLKKGIYKCRALAPCDFLKKSSLIRVLVRPGRKCFSSPNISSGLSMTSILFDAKAAIKQYTA